MNWISYYYQNDGYGRFSSRLVKELQKLMPVKIATPLHIDMPDWMQRQERIDWSKLTISCMPAYEVKKVPGVHWLFTMTEGSLILPHWLEAIERAEIERVIVPCHHNLLAFQNSGVKVPISIIPGGTDPKEFPFNPPPLHKPYTFLTFADRGFRKGWEETCEAFYAAFGGKTTGNQDVKLIVKVRPDQKDYHWVSRLAEAVGADKRIQYVIEDSLSMQEIYALADCLVLPSRSEGWGMIQREAACSGMPVITQRYSGLDDGHTGEWAFITEEGRLRLIPLEDKKSLGEWMLPDIASLSRLMKFCYDSPESALSKGYLAHYWISHNQTWGHSARKLEALIHAETGRKIYMERDPQPVEERVREGIS